MDYTFKPRAKRISRQGNLATWQVEITHGEFYTVNTHAMANDKTAINNALYLAMLARTDVKHSQSHYPGNPCNPTCTGYRKAVTRG